LAVYNGIYLEPPLIFFWGGNIGQCHLEVKKQYMKRGERKRGKYERKSRKDKKIKEK
jgi:hypothetical protein